MYSSLASPLQRLAYHRYLLVEFLQWFLFRTSMCIPFISHYMNLIIGFRVISPSPSNIPPSNSPQLIPSKFTIYPTSIPTAALGATGYGNKLTLNQTVIRSVEYYGIPVAALLLLLMLCYFYRNRILSSLRRWIMGCSVSDNNFISPTISPHLLSEDSIPFESPIQDYDDRQTFEIMYEWGKIRKAYTDSYQEYDDSDSICSSRSLPV